ncbi:putative bifunctional diguanylate cyclase/phosphodiesterase [Novosphingobium lentum]|uniref:putative bifunctional diguanylate cyclase/phosphodiesterase n=1 Tax=Novosphingobium lentum TaxID=145287 RepID=UPI000834A2B7|nr:EAL domain-containing protein [Novosphingobium lentum]
MRGIASLFRLDAEDSELARAQFRSFSKQMPLLYLILICNCVAIMVDFFRPDHLFKTFCSPILMCAMALARALWWRRQDGASFTDAEIATHIRRTCTVAVLMTLAFQSWCMWVYGNGDAYARGHLSFFLALTQVSTVFCLMTMRAAAMRVAATSTLIFVIFFAGVDRGRMLVEAMVLCCVGLGMMVVTYRYNLDFSQLIMSQRDLHNRQVETEKLSEENRRIALTDALSGLPNRRELLSRLDRLEQDPGAAADSLAVVFIDLDGFKDINDAHGHQAGDTLIRSLSVRLRGICPRYATLARVGGDEFAVLIEAPGATAEATLLAQQINEEICLPVLVDRHVLQVGASIGIAGNADGPLRAHELLRRADTAMYHVKMHGKGEIAVYDTAFDQGRLRRMAIEHEIGKGLANNEFEVFYQPVVEAIGGKIVATEALIRWPHRPDGPLDPQQFIDIAEATGQILPLGLFVLERACRNIKPLGDVKLSVNVSPAQFRDPGFERQVAHVLEQTRFPPERLQFEITEGYLLAHPERAVRAIEAFKAMGMSIALDDFGTGFTSIHYLQSYGFSHIKIDKSLLSGLHPGSKSSLLVTGAINLACGLDMRVIAEGVETEEQADLLRAAGCHKLQGYLFGRPMPIADFVAAYRSSNVGQRKAPRRLAG